MAISTTQKKNLNWVIAVFVTVALAIIALMYVWQVQESDRFLIYATSRYKDVKIPSVRGSILAADGSTLAYSEPRYDAFVWLPDLELAEKNGHQTRDEFMNKVSSELGITPDELLSKFLPGQKWIKIASRITYDTKQLLGGLKSSAGKTITGIQYQYVNRRVYPEGKLAGQVMGYVGLYDPEAKGTWGLEQYWDGSLRPLEGIQSSEFDSFGNPIALAGTESIDSKPGATLYTTIDKTLQLILETKLKEGFEQFKTSAATGIILDPKTGAILAMANYPSYDPNKYYEVQSMEEFGNKAISTPYEIGSVAKALTLSAAIDLGKVTPDTVLLPEGHEGCEIISPNPEPGDKCTTSNETKKNSDRIIDCICVYNRKPVRRSISVYDALTSSDNIAFRHIALTMNYQEYYEYLVKFGAGRPTQVDLSGESYANLKEGAKWNYADQAVYSYGHGYSMTPLQVAMAYATIANDGVKMQPFIVSKMIDSDGKVTEFKPKALEQVIKKETAQTVQTMMHQVYLNQLIESRYRDLKKFNIGLKSGTALIPYTDRGGYSSDINTTFAGYDAGPDKKFVMLIKLEKPEVGDLSFYNARILWLDTFAAIKEYLHM